MAAVNNDVVKEGHKRRTKEYGNTTANDSSRVHLGDVLQEVKIGGDLHVHYHQPVDDVTTAGVVSRFLHCCQELVSHHDSMLLGQYDKLRATHLDSLLKSLTQICSQLKVERAKLSSREVMGHCSEEKILHRILETADADAAYISKSLKIIRDARRREIASYLPKSSCQELCSTFLEHWKKYDLGARIESCYLLRQGVNKYFDTMLNAKQGSSRKDVGRNGFVQLLTMHEDIKPESQPLGAVLMRENGEEVMLTLPSFRSSQHNTKGMQVIRYDLETSGSSGAPDPPDTDKVVKKRWNFVHFIKSKLSFREESYRRIEVKEAHSRTFEWIFEASDSNLQSQFLRWLGSGENVFWINGKPGSGKSTLMKFIHQHPLLLQYLKAWSAGRQLITANFFFWAVGQPLQRSYEGILRSLLHQVLEARPDLTAVIFPELSRHLLYKHAENCEFQDPLSMQELYEAMKLFCRDKPDDLAVFLVVDGIDEYHGDHVEFSKFILQLANTPCIKVLVSSRPIPACTQIFSPFPGLRLQDLTAGDIRNYIEAELLQNHLLIDMEALEPGLAIEIENALLSKASGVFLWIYLVVNTLLRGLGESDDRSLLMQKIDAMPTDLELLYDHLFAGMSSDHRKEGCILLRLVTHAREKQSGDLTALQLFAAVKYYHTKTECCLDTAYIAQQNDRRVKNIDGKLQSRCRGLVEVQYRDNDFTFSLPRVDYLHRTVYDYLCEPSVSERITNDSGILTEDIDFVLLTSAAHLLRKLPFDPRGSLVKEPELLFAELFAACIYYARALDRRSDHRYLPYLSSVDESHQGGDMYYLNAQVYDNALSIVGAKESIHFPATPISFQTHMVHRPFTRSLPAFARSGLHKCFAYKFRKCTFNPRDKACLLLLMLLLRRTPGLSRELTSNYSLNIELLLADGTDPTRGAVVVGAGDGMLTQACRMTGLGVWLSPWEFWISQPIKTIGDLCISIKLLNAKSPVLKVPQQALLVAQFHKTLENYRARGIWPEDSRHASSEEPLPVLEQVEESTITLKRSNPDDREGSATNKRRT